MLKVAEVAGKDARKWSPHSATLNSRKKKKKNISLGFGVWGFGRPLTRNTKPEAVALKLLFERCLTHNPDPRGACQKKGPFLV